LHAVKSAHLGITHQQSNIDLYAGDRWAREATERLLPFANAMPNNTDFGTYWNAMWGGFEASSTGQKTTNRAGSDVEAGLKSSLGEALVIHCPDGEKMNTARDLAGSGRTPIGVSAAQSRLHLGWLSSSKGLGILFLLPAVVLVILV